MKTDFEKAKNYPIFASLTPEEIKNISGAVTKEYRKSDIIIHEGDVCSRIGVIISGTLRGEIYSEEGRRDIVSVFTEGDVFGDVLALGGGKKSPVTVLAVTDSAVLFIPYNSLFEKETGTKILKNLTSVISANYLRLLYRVGCISKSTLRGKVMCFLHRFAPEQTDTEFTVPLDRNSMADFLAVDRSALSRELSKMQSDGIIKYRKNKFTIIGGVRK